MPNARDIPAVIFLPPAGASRAERWLAGARIAAAADLLQNLQAAGFGTIFVIAAEKSDQEELHRLGGRLLAEGPPPFHFGRTLARVVEELGFTRLAYFGGASAPLAKAEALRVWRQQASGLPPGGALVNNVYSTDWAILDDAARVIPLADRLASDNSIGWVLKEEAGASVEEPGLSIASRTDFDTPGDLALLRDHSLLGRRLRQALEPFPDSLHRRVERLSEVVRAPAASVALIGRVSENAWREMVRRAQVWARVFAEERGMRASGRQQRGEVRSLIGDLVDDEGPTRFTQRLESMVQAAVWDTRVWMAQRAQGWPSAGDRMAADLGWLDEIQDVPLLRLTEAIAGAAIPIVTGGHGVVSGSLMAFLETLFPDTSR